MSVNVFEHPWLGGLFADPALAELFSADVQIGHMIAFERALTDALEATGRIDAGAARAARAALGRYRPDMPGLRAGTARDGVVVPALVAALRADGAGTGLHSGATSQDVVDTALALTLKAVSDLLVQRLAGLVDQLANLQARFGMREMTARTRMQAALPMRVGHRIDAWSGPLIRAQAQVPLVAADIAQLSLSGPVGDGRHFGEDWNRIGADMAAALGLAPPRLAAHADRGAVVGYGDWLSRLSGALGKLGQDLALMAQQGVDEVRLAGGGASSAMAHKQNPVLAELLVTLARFNAAQTAALHGALVHEQERSGAAWAVEWMVLPPMAAATARALTAASDLVGSIEDMGR